MCTGSLSTSEFPVFTMYAEKICLESACNKPWSFETVIMLNEGRCIKDTIFPSWHLCLKVPSSSLEGHTRARVGAEDLTTCMQLCLARREFTCRWPKIQTSTFTVCCKCFFLSAPPYYCKSAFTPPEPPGLQPSTRRQDCALFQRFSSVYQFATPSIMVWSG